MNSLHVGLVWHARSRPVVAGHDFASWTSPHPVIYVNFIKKTLICRWVSSGMLGHVQLMLDTTLQAEHDLAIKHNLNIIINKAGSHILYICIYAFLCIYIYI
jgi:hypothetical protein